MHVSFACVMAFYDMSSRAMSCQFGARLSTCEIKHGSIYSAATNLIANYEYMRHSCYHVVCFAVMHRLLGHGREGD